MINEFQSCVNIPHYVLPTHCEVVATEYKVIVVGANKRHLFKLFIANLIRHRQPKSLSFIGMDEQVKLAKGNF